MSRCDVTPLLEIEDLSIEFATPRGPAHVVSGLSYSVAPGECLAIVGESGSGKSVHALTIAGLLNHPAARITSGRILFNGVDMLAMSDDEVRRVRGSQIGYVFQDPLTSLNPVLTVERQLTDPLRVHLGLSARAARDRAVELLSLVGIKSPHERLGAYAHQLSGGQRQRVMIAMAISCNPRLLIADEATTALDVTVQAQIIDLLGRLKDELDLTMIWISHDLGAVARIADSVQVMYAGRIAERGPVDAVYYHPRSAYTVGLLRSLPGTGPRRDRLFAIPGQPPAPTALPPGDAFAERNPFATERCFIERPPLRQVEGGMPGHLVAAWYRLDDGALEAW